MLNGCVQGEPMQVQLNQQWHTYNFFCKHHLGTINKRNNIESFWWKKNHRSCQSKEGPAAWWWEWLCNNSKIVASIKEMMPNEHKFLTCSCYLTCLLAWKWLENSRKNWTRLNSIEPQPLIQEDCILITQNFKTEAAAFTFSKTSWDSVFTLYALIKFIHLRSNQICKLRNSSIFLLIIWMEYIG